MINVTHLRLPDIPSDYILDPNQGFWSILVPEATTNLLTNPSAEASTTAATDWDGQAVTLGISDDDASEGSLCVEVASGVPGPGENILAGAEFTATANEIYTCSIDVKGLQNLAYRLVVTDDSFIIRHTGPSFVGDEEWHRYEMTFQEKQGGGTRYFGVQQVNEDGNGWWMDRAQVENKPYSTTYADGDQSKFGEDDKYIWLGDAHASQSMRMASARSGGRWVNLKDACGFMTSSMMGLDHTEYDPINQSMHDGRVRREGMIIRPREFTITGRLCGRSWQDLASKKRQLIDLLRQPADTPLRLRYEYTDMGGRPWGLPLYIDAYFMEGLGGIHNNHYSEDVALQWIAYSPYLYRGIGESKRVSENNSVSGRHIFIRSAEGEWSAMPSLSGGDSTPYAVEYDRNGDIWVGGSFDLSAATAVNNILVIRDGTVEAVPDDTTTPGFNNAVSDLVVTRGNRIYAGGYFTATDNGAKTLNYIAYHNGTLWTQAGDGLNAPVFYMDIDNTGQYIYLAGQFTQTANASVTGLNYVARLDWLNGTYSALGTGFDSAPNAVKVGPLGNVWVAGTRGGVTGVWRWDGSAWTQVGDEFDLAVDDLAFDKGGRLYAVGFFDAVGTKAVSGFARWNGSTWNQPDDWPGGVDPASDLSGIHLAPDGMLYVTATNMRDRTGLPDYTSTKGTRWNGENWVPLDFYYSGTSIIEDIAFQDSGEMAVVVGNDATNSIILPGNDPVVNESNVEVHPRIILRGPGDVISLENMTTGQRIFFDLTLASGELAVLDLEPNNIRFYSNYRVDLIQNVVLAVSDLNRFVLEHGTNYLNALVINDSTPTKVHVFWHPLYEGISEAF